MGAERHLHRHVRALVIGDVHLIAAGSVRDFPRPGDNVILSDGFGAVSGVGTNISHALRALGVDVDLAGAIGEDIFGEAIMADLSERGIGTQHMQRSADPTSVFLIVVDGTGERTMVGYRGACERFTLDRRLLDTPYQWIHMSGYTMLNDGMPGAFARLTEEAGARSIPCSVDLEGLAQARRHVALAGLTVLCNIHEYTAYFETEDIRCPPGAERVIVKAGDSGCFLADGIGITHVPAYPTVVCDLTGAGDAFNAGYIAACLAGLPPIEACRWGNAAGSLKVRHRGPTIDLTISHLRAVLGAAHVQP